MRTVLYNGKKCSLNQFSKQTKIAASTLVKGWKAGHRTAAGLITYSRRKKVLYKNEYYTLTDFAKLIGIPYNTLQKVFVNGERDGDKLIERAKGSRIFHNGRFYTRLEQAEITGVPYPTLARRLARGETLEQASTNGLRYSSFSHNAHLTPTQILIIYQRYHEGDVTQSELARQYKVSQSAIHHIVHDHTWGWLTTPLKFIIDQNRH